MPRGNYEPEIRTAIGDSKLGRINTSLHKESPADIARDKKGGIKEGSPQDQKLDAMPQNMQQPGKPQPLNTVQNADLPRKPQVPQPPQVPIPPDAAHIAAATSIAHAILGHRGVG